MIKMAKEGICPYLNGCINVAMYNCSFPGEVTKTDVSAIVKKGDPN